VGTVNLWTTEVVTFSASTGLVCVNADQTDRRCENYEIRFCCEPDNGNTVETQLVDGDCPVDGDRVQWSNWMSRDFPSMTGDWELRTRLVSEGYLNKECSPIAAEGRMIGSTATWTNEVVTFSASYGLVCQNAAQPDRTCEDYEIRFCCKYQDALPAPGDTTTSTSDARDETLTLQD